MSSSSGTNPASTITASTGSSHTSSTEIPEQRQHRAAETVEALLQQVVERVDVAGQPGDETAGGERLVEVERQALTVREHPPPHVQQHVLPDAPGEQQEGRAQPGRGGGRARVARDRPHERRGVARHRGRDARVDGRRDEQRPRQLGEGLSDEQQQGRRDRAPVRPDERAEQLPGLPLHPQPCRSPDRRRPDSVGDAAPTAGGPRPSSAVTSAPRRHSTAAPGSRGWSPAARGAFPRPRRRRRAASPRGRRAGRWTGGAPRPAR